MSYKRVIPRDLFNESKLLKCLGKISLWILDRKIQGVLEEHDGQPFRIIQTEDGALYVSNIEYTDTEGNSLHFSTPLNSRAQWPLELLYKDELYYPINEKGEYQLAKDLFTKGESA